MNSAELTQLCIFRWKIFLNSVFCGFFLNLCNMFTKFFPLSC